jgi:FOG: HEAT repeat
VRKDKKTLALIAFGAVLLLLLLSALPLEPRWKGRSLSNWVLVNGGSKRDDHYNPKYAISQIGSNAVPYLLRWIKQKPSNRQIWFRNFKTTHPFMGKFVPTLMTGDGIELRARYAMQAFECLGEAGVSAVGDLSEFATNRTDAYMAEYATYALCSMGAKVTPALLTIVTNRQADVRSLVIYKLGQSRRVQAIPALVRCLGDTNACVSSSAADALGQLKQEPATVAPALVELLKRPIPDSDFRHREHLASILWALGAFGTNSNAATPELLRMLGESTDDSRSCEIMKTLTEITMQPEIVISALTNHLDGTNGLLRDYAALSLSRMGARAQSALPSLTNSLKFADTRKMVALAIRRISSSASTNRPSR